MRSSLLIFEEAVGLNKALPSENPRFSAVFDLLSSNGKLSFSDPFPFESHQTTKSS